MVDGAIVEQLGRDNLLDDLLLEVFAQLLSRNLFGVLGRDDDSVNADGDDFTRVLALGVLDSDLLRAFGASD